MRVLRRLVWALFAVSGCLPRLPFLGYFILAFIIGNLPFVALGGFMSAEQTNIADSLVENPLVVGGILVWGVLLFYCTLCVIAKRMHDIGLSALWLIAFYGLLVVLYLTPLAEFSGILNLCLMLALLFIPPKMENNKYREAVEDPAE